MDISNGSALLLNQKNSSVAGRAWRGESSLSDVESFRQAIRQHGDRIHNFARRLAGNDPDAADLTQEALTRAFAHREQFESDKSFPAWVCRILHNHFLDNQRRYERRHAVSYDAPKEGAPWADFLKGQDPTPLDTLLKKERDASVQKALGRLPPLYRTPLILCDLEHFSYDEIATVLECPLGTVRSRLFEARRLLRDAYQKITEDRP